MNRPESFGTHAARMLALVLACCAPAIAQNDDPITLVRHAWGFDGTVVPQAFNLLTLEVRNGGREPFEGVIRLERSNGVQPVDAPVMEEVYLAAGASRQVQFFPYIILGLRGSSTWSVSWGVLDRGRFVVIDRADLNEPKAGDGATVIVRDPYDVTASRGGGGLKPFDEVSFPQTVNGTRGLAAVVLDHEPPQWNPLQQRSFLDWLHAGGSVHLLHGSDGDYPRFGGLLQELNSPLETVRVGSGRVVRHPLSLLKLDGAYADANILPPKPAAPPTDPNNPNANFGYGNYVAMDVNDNLFMRMRQMTRPDHNWALIYFMALVYLLIVFPGCWLIGKRRADYRVTYGALLGAVALFSLGFKTVGQRGYGERTAAHAVALVRPISDGRMAVQQWTNLFVTDGGFYREKHQADGRVYSTGQTNEGVRGWVVNFPGGTLDVDIPPFSARTVASATTGGAAPFRVVAEKFVADEHLRELLLKVDGTFPENAGELRAVYGNETYALGRRDGSLVLSGGGLPLPQYFAGAGWQDDVYNYSPFGWGGETDPKKLFEGAARPLLAASLGVYNDETVKQFRLPNDRLRLFVYAEMPDAMFPQMTLLTAPDELLKRHAEGRVMYAMDVLRPDAGGGVLE